MREACQINVVRKNRVTRTNGSPGLIVTDTAERSCSFPCGLRCIAAAAPCVITSSAAKIRSCSTKACRAPRDSATANDRGSQKMRAKPFLTKLGTAHIKWTFFLPFRGVLSTLRLCIAVGNAVCRSAVIGRVATESSVATAGAI
jgi:hypothetical protein